MPASAADGFLVGSERLKLDIKQHFVDTDNRVGDKKPESRRVSRVGIVREIIDLLICRALCVCLADKGAALQVGNAPGYVLRLVG